MDFTPNPSFEREYAHSPGTRDALQEAVLEVHDVFQRIAPRDTGRMVNSAHPELNRTPHGWEAVYAVPVETTDGRNTKYAKFVEFGTRYMRAQHNLRNALEIVQQERS